MVAHRSRGFTLVEAVVALAVVSVLAGALLAAGPIQLRGAGDAFRDSVALRLAEADLERAATEYLDVGVDAPRPVDSDALDSPTVTRTVTEREPGLFEVEARVAWEEPGGTRRDVRLTTLVAAEAGR